MRRPAHANPGAPHFTVTAFEKGKRHALSEVSGTDPSNVAKAVAGLPALSEVERKNVRPKMREALQAMADRAIPNLTDAQLEFGGRRFRIRLA